MTSGVMVKVNLRLKNVGMNLSNEHRQCCTEQKKRYLKSCKIKNGLNKSEYMMKETTATIIRQDPFIAFINNLMTEEECDSVIARLEEAEFARSEGFNYENNENDVSDYRTSKTFYDMDNIFSDYTQLVFNSVKDRFWYMPFSIQNLELVQSQRYGVGEEYKKHCDYFNYGPTQIKTNNDRIATMILYLNDDFEGGETEFHELGIKIKPKKGAALYFEYNYIPELNHKTIHSGNPVTKGEKLIFTTWIRHHPYSGGI